MSAPHPQEKRDLAIKWRKEGMKNCEVARLLGVTPSCVSKWYDQYLTTGSVEIAKIGGHRKPILEEHEELVLGVVGKNPTGSLGEHVKKLAEMGIKVCRETLRTFIASLGMCFKKISRIASRRKDQDVIDQRVAWLNKIRELHAGNVYCLDESSVKDNMFPTHGWGWVGVPLELYAPCGGWIKWTCIAALCLQGLKAIEVFRGALNKERFFVYVRDHLAPILKEGDIVVMDNLSCHHYPDALDLIRAKGAEVMFLPPYSPDLNPIEEVWSPVKSRLRKDQPRTLEEATESIKRAAAEIRPESIAGCFANSGFIST